MDWPMPSPWLAVEAGTDLLARARQIHDAAEVLLAAFWQLVTAGSVHDAMNGGAAYGVWLLVALGRWEEAREVLRLLLSHRLRASPGAVARGVAALLALRTGDVAAGRAHLARARELQPRSARAGDILEFIEVEAKVELGQLREALSIAELLMPAQVTLDPAAGDELLVIAARAAGDLAEQVVGPDEAVALLERIVGLRGSEPPPFERMEPEDAVHPANGALFAADRARCHGDPDTADLWRAAVARCREAGMVWHEALASYQLARALLGATGSRTEAASALRHAARLATDLGAVPVLRDVEELAIQVHVPLDEPAPAEPVAELSALTPREREVLSHLVAGRTYAEIAEALFISEKTVSVHVSNLLRKTGTRSRVEVAALARRTGTA